MALSYRKLTSEKQWLRVQQRARKLQVFLQDLNLEGNLLKWKVQSGTTKGLFWHVTIDVSQVDLEYKLTKWSFNDFAKTIREMGLKVWCDDPSFWYWGSAYRSQKYGYAVYSKPKASKPIKGLRAWGRPTVCKHIFSVLTTWPFWSSWLSKRFKPVFEKRLSEKYKSTNSTDAMDPSKEDSTHKEDSKVRSVKKSLRIGDVLDVNTTVEDILRRLE